MTFKYAATYGVRSAEATFALDLEGPTPVAPEPQVSITTRFGDAAGVASVRDGTFECTVEESLSKPKDGHMSYDECRQTCADEGLAMPCLRNEAMVGKFYQDMVPVSYTHLTLPTILLV